ncbi:uncharacterized protein LOC107605680 [Arachis ipaensis]|uniref:uncharacterized protein LOC107605680 n=1 Tax=Arachis ipaensis TaxID=130454 RepID=UPI0007AFC0EA|nr:uncharacterized protein LOC107605680 [Arachis ipaensis]XP_025628123.1 uncharacterized protein LOC112721269 [Arachis hypogaea]
MATENVYIVLYPNGEISVTSEGVTFVCDDPLWIMIPPQSSLEELKNVILVNTGIVGKKKITKLTYRMPVAVANSFTYQKMQIKSDQQVSMMFSYHRSIGNIYSLELCVCLQDLGGSFSSSNNVVNHVTGGNRCTRPPPCTRVASPEGIGGGLADTSDEDEIEDDSGEEAEVVPETQPVYHDRDLPSRVESVGGSSDTPGHYLSLNLGAMGSATAEDTPSNYALSGEMELEVGLKFLNRETAMLAVKNYNIRRGAEYKVVESDQTRYVCRCKQFGDQCRWSVRVAKTRASRFWMIRKYEGPHSCLATSMSQDHAQLDSDVICHHIHPMVQADATICVKVLQGSVESAYGYKVSYKKVWHAKQKAIVKIYGDWDESYDQLRRYFNALQAFIPGTIVDLQTRPNYVGNTLDRQSVVFHQVFWSFPSCVEAFRHCKPLVSVDGTHLYGKYAGTLLMGIAQDGNNNILPIAFAIVERENTDSWFFFLSNLRRHVATQPGILLISDRHSAIRAALERPGCGWEHNVYCVRHIASNFATTFKSKEAKKHLVNAAYSKTAEQAQYYLDLISSEDPTNSPQMMAWIRGLEPPKWLQHRDEGRRYGHMTTNLSECINSVLKGTCNLPVCAIVKSTFHRLNALFVKKGREAQSQIACGQVFSQFLQKAILANREGISQMLVTSYDRATSIFTVDEIAAVGYQSRFRVYLEHGRCDCGYFQALHYPCAHALAACAHARLDWQRYVAAVYRVDSVFRVYEMEFPPMLDEELWPPYVGERVVPNLHLRRTMEGRPVSTRIRNEMDEVEPGPGKRCGLCRQPGHTRRNCPHINST